MKRNVLMQCQQDIDRRRPSKEKFVRDMMRMYQSRESDRKEAEAQAIINEPCAYYSAKSYARGKKYTKQAFQC